jgi:hypothetical protein
MSNFPACPMIAELWTKQYSTARLHCFIHNGHDLLPAKIGYTFNDIRLELNDVKSSQGLFVSNHLTYRRTQAVTFEICKHKLPRQPVVLNCAEIPYYQGSSQLFACKL